MKKQPTKLMSLGLTLALTLSLTACGGNPAAHPNTTYDPASASGQGATAEGVTLSNWLGEGESIWYVTETPVSQLGKDTQVETLLLLEADGTAYAGNAGGKTLGELAQMDEADIVQLAQDAYATAAKPDILRNFAERSDVERMIMLNEEFFNNALQECVFDSSMMADELSQYGLPEALNEPLQSYLEAFSTYSGDVDALFTVIQGICSYEPNAVDDVLENCPESADAITAFLEQEYAIQDKIAAVLSAKPEPGRWALGLNTDQTGNNVESVTFAWCIYRPDATEISSVACYASSGEGKSVYDVLYGGVDLNGGGSLVTRVDGSYNVVLESTDSGLPLDAEPEELFS